MLAFAWVLGVSETIRCRDGFWVRVILDASDTGIAVCCARNNGGLNLLGKGAVADLEGNKTIDMEIDLTGTHALTQSDFLLS